MFAIIEEVHRKKEIEYMGLIYSKLILANPRKPELRSIEVNALADSGALHLCLPKHIALQLELDELYKREVTIANGNRELVPYMGPVEVKFENRGCYTGALVFGDEVLLGAVPMEDMDIVINSAKRTVMVNPENPNIASSKVK